MYNKYILPRILNYTCGQKPFTKQREKIVPLAQGKVLEVGIGSGLNMSYLNPNKVDSFTGIDPSEDLLAMAESQVSDSISEINLIASTAEEMQFENNSFDSVLMTYTLCTVQNASVVLNQIKRVLKQDGQLIFCEHGLAPEFNIITWQNRINQFWPLISGGCNLNKDIPKLFEAEGFTVISMDEMYLPKTPKLLGYNYWGTAKKEI